MALYTLTEDYRSIVTVPLTCSGLFAVSAVSVIDGENKVINTVSQAVTIPFIAVIGAFEYFFTPAVINYHATVRIVFNIGYGQVIIEPVSIGRNNIGNGQVAGFND
jgi:hypothetical protein